MSKKHTPEPWMYYGNIDHKSVHKTQLIIQERKTNAANIAEVIPCAGMTAAEVKANAERIVQCVNDCAGIDFPKSYISNLCYERDRAKAERDKAESRYLRIRSKTTEVRDLQKRYFKSRDNAILIQSKKSEAELDKLLDTLLYE